MKKYYKVVSVHRNRYYSCMLSVGHGVNRREYFTDKFATPSKPALKKGYLLTCFEKLKDVISFDPDPSFWDDEIWEVEIEGKKITHKRLPPIDCFADIRKGGLCGWPKGTIMAEKIRLIRRVK